MTQLILYIILLILLLLLCLAKKISIGELLIADMLLIIILKLS